MTRRNANNSRSRGRRGVLSEETKQTRLLETIKRQNDLEIKGKMPDVPDIPRMFIKRNKVYTFSRTVLAGQVSASTTVDQLGALSFTLNAFPNASEFTALFDQYRIQQVEVDFIYVNPASVIAPLYTVIDLDDATAPSFVSDLLQYQTLMQTAPGQQHVRRVRPRAAMAAYSGAFTSFAQSLPGQWIDVASPSVQFYGIKYALPALTGGTAGVVFSIQVTAILQFQSPR